MFVMTCCPPVGVVLLGRARHERCVAAVHLAGGVASTSPLPLCAVAHRRGDRGVGDVAVELAHVVREPGYRARQHPVDVMADPRGEVGLEVGAVGGHARYVRGAVGVHRVRAHGARLGVLGW